MKKNNFNVIDLFSGPGGFSCGFEQADFNVLTGIDFEKNAINTYNQNHKHEGMLRDLTNLEPKEIEEFIGTKKIDVIIGSPPCQGFSTAGRRYVDDPRNQLYKEFVKVVEHFMPLIVVMENVYGLVQMKKKDGKKVVDDIVSDFEELGYNMDYQVLHAADYGVPQRRKRVIFIANKCGIKNIFPEKTHTDVSKGQAISGNLKPHVTVDEAINDLPEKFIEEINHIASKTSDIDLERIKLLKEGQWAADLPEHMQPTKCKPHPGGGEWFYGRNRRMHGKETARTVTAVAPLYHPKYDRKLTVRENARFQTFPDNFIFTGSLASQYRQVGDAVPPLLAKKIGESIIEMLKSLECQKFLQD